MGTKREVNVSSPFIWLLTLGVIIWNTIMGGFLFLQVGWTDESADSAIAWVLELYWGAAMSELGGIKRNKNCKYHFWKLRPEICCYNPCITWPGSKLWSWSGVGVSVRCFSDTFLICTGMFCIILPKYLSSWMFVIYFLKLYIHIYTCKHTSFYLAACSNIYLVHFIFFILFY